MEELAWESCVAEMFQELVKLLVQDLAAVARPVLGFRMVVESQSNVVFLDEPAQTGERVY